mgnify:CR=1 FL=1
MKKILALIILLALGFNSFCETPQTTQERLSLPLFPKVDYENVELKATLRHLLRRPECLELGLFYEMASEVNGCSVTLKNQQINLLQCLNAICIQNKLRFSFKDNCLYFYNDIRPRLFSQKTTGNRDIDLRLSQIFLPKRVEMDVVNYSTVLWYLDKETKDSKEFVFVWEYDKPHAYKNPISALWSRESLLSIIQEICQKGNLEFHYSEGILFFIPKARKFVPISQKPERLPHKQNHI